MAEVHEPDAIHVGEYGYSRSALLLLRLLRGPRQVHLNQPLLTLGSYWRSLKITGRNCTLLGFAVGPCSPRRVSPFPYDSIRTLLGSVVEAQQFRLYDVKHSSVMSH